MLTDSEKKKNVQSRKAPSSLFKFGTLRKKAAKKQKEEN